MRVNQLDQLIRLLQFNTLRYSPCGHRTASQLSEFPRNAGVRVLCGQNFLCQHLSRRHSADSDDGGFAVYVQRAEGLHRRLQSVDEAGRGDLPHRLHADNASVLGAADLCGQYAAGARHHAGGQRSAAHRAAVRS